MSSYEPNPAIAIPEDLRIACQIAAPLAIEVSVLRGQRDHTPWWKLAQELRSKHRKDALYRAMANAMDATRSFNMDLAMNALFSAWRGYQKWVAHGSRPHVLSADAQYFVDLAPLLALSTLATEDSRPAVPVDDRNLWLVKWGPSREWTAAQIDDFMPGGPREVARDLLLVIDEELRRDNYRMLLEYPETFHEMASLTLRDLARKKP
jgi:hypothetical protein